MANMLRFSDLSKQHTIQNFKAYLSKRAYHFNFLLFLEKQNIIALVSFKPKPITKFFQFLFDLIAALK